MSRPRRHTGAAMAIAALFAAGCADDGGPAEPNGDPTPIAESTTTSTTVPTDETTTTTEAAAVTPVGMVVNGPITAGAGPVFPQPAVAPPEGWVTEEFFVAGTASSYDFTAEPAPDGFWEVAEVDTADYETRILVRRPPAADFSGTVIVEWLNVTAIEASPDWAYMVEHIGEAGHAHVAVSVQALGVIGGEPLLSAEVDEDAAGELGAEGELPDVTGGLVGADPERYGNLTHPGDAFAYDIYTQVGAAIAAEAPTVLGGLEPTALIALGQSQSAFFLTSYVNAVHPRSPVYDGFMIHSRGGGGAPIGGGSGDDTSFSVDAARIRTDLTEPVFMVETETDLTLLGYAPARQPDTDRIRTWELAGTAHADAHILRAAGGSRDPSVGSLLGCGAPINAGPHHEGLQAALARLVRWVAEGTPPPTGEPIATEREEGTLRIVRDELGIAVGGVRNPLVDVPVAVYSGDPPGPDAGGSGLCGLFGQTATLDRDTLLDLHGSGDAYVAAFEASAAAAVDAGFLLPTDAEQLIAEAEENRALFEG